MLRAEDNLFSELSPGGGVEERVSAHQPQASRAGAVEGKSTER